MTDDPQRLYLLAPPGLDDPATLARFEEALAVLPVACVRLDLGEASEADWTRAANLAIEPCHRQDVALVITDHHRLVASLGLDGVHLARSRTPVREVRKDLGPNRIVGAFAGTSRHQGMVLAEAGCDYVSFGPVGETGVLGDDERVDPELFVWWAEMIETPSVAEGGLDLAEARALAETADFMTPDARIWSDPATALDRLREIAALL